MSSESAGRFLASFIGNTLIEGTTTYHIKVTGPDGDTWNIQKRYREIRELHEELRLRHGDSLPQFPGKRFWGNQDPAFIAQRQIGLQQYLQGVLQIEAGETTPALKTFLGGPPQGGERNQARQYHQILEHMQSRLLNLALPPAPLDENEVAQRVKKYGQVMRSYVLSQPVDPIHLRAPGFDGEPAPPCPANADQLESLKQPVGSTDAQALTGLLDSLHMVLRPDQPIANPDNLIVPFPEISVPSQPAS